ncbi:MAG: T9SS C-terminal target domain-containing protein, partial [Bacteroidetes bacterium]
SLKVFPNPGKDRFFLQGIGLPPGSYRVRLYDVRGKHLRAWSWDGRSTLTLDLHSLPAGVYPLRVGDAEQAGWVRVVKL